MHVHPVFVAGFTTDVLLVEVCGLEKPLRPLVPLVVAPLVPFVIVPLAAAVAGLELNVLGAPFEAAAPLSLLWPYVCIEFTQLVGRIGQLRGLKYVANQLAYVIGWFYFNLMVSNGHHALRT